MRLWHTDLIPHLPRQQLLGLHREVCALRGNGWGKKHSTVNYVFRYSPEYLFNYHLIVMLEMKKRNYKPNPIWNDFFYRGKHSDPWKQDWTNKNGIHQIYPEHDFNYLKSCVKNLLSKIYKAKPGKYNESEIFRLYSWIKEQNINK